MIPHSHLLHSNQAPLSTNPRTLTLELPPEIWRHVFIDATSSSINMGIHMMESQQASQRNVACSLSLVCRMWRAIVLPLLYENVWIHKPLMARHFLRTLADSASTGVSPQAGYAKWVRSLILPDGRQRSGWEDLPIADILNRCMDIRFVTKLADVTPDFWHGIACTTSCPTCPTLGSFTSLRRVFWACSLDSEVIAIDAQRLITLIQHAPNLASLHILNMGQSSYSFELRSSNPWASLTTIEYQSLMRNATLTIRPDDVPNLSHIIADPATLRFSDIHNENVDLVLGDFGEQLRVIELPDVMIINGAAPDIDSILHHCPNLHTFGYNIMSNVLLPDNRVLHPSLSVVALKVPKSHPADEELVRQCLQTNIRKITRRIFPALRQIKLKIQGQQFHRERLQLENAEGISVVWDPETGIPESFGFPLPRQS